MNNNNSNENSYFKYLKKLLPGASLGVTVTLIGHPFDTIKTRSQTGLYSSNAYNSLKETLRNEGVKGLYRGASIPMVSHVVKRSYQYPLFHHLNENLGINPYLSGMITGSTGSIIGVPLQVIKINTQTSTKQKYKGVMDFTLKNFQRNGIYSFYKGFQINLFKDSVFSSSFIGNYIYLKKLKQINDMGHFGNFFAGGFSHMITWGIFIPIDHIKTTVQKQDNNTNVRCVIKKTINSGAYRSLWRGIGPALLRIFPMSGSGMVVYEIVKDFIKK